MKLKGYMRHAIRRNGMIITPWLVDPNLVVTEGLTYVLNVSLRAQPQIATFYLAIFAGNYTPIASDNAANMAANSQEFADYTAATRVAWNIDAVMNNRVTNEGNTAVFTVNTPTVIYGAFLVSESAKQSGSGILIAASRFAARRELTLANDELLVQYDFTAADGA